MSTDTEDEKSDSDEASRGNYNKNRLRELGSAQSLKDLIEITGEENEHDAYFKAKREWYELMDEKLDASPPPPKEETGGIPGDCVVVDGHRFCVHGITHADTTEEGEFLRRNVSELLDQGAVIYCEQGVRSMYFSDLSGACEMDDYTWAMNRCKELEIESHIDEPETTFEGVKENLNSMTSELEDAVFSLINSGSDYYGNDFRDALGDIASDFLMSHEDFATGDDFESFRWTKEASKNPEKLVELQNYYRKRFLPQPVEREWIRRHDRELELMTHARNERMADYAIYHNENAEEVHLIVGAAHQPGVIYYLEKYRDGEKEIGEFELFG